MTDKRNYADVTISTGLQQCATVSLASLLPTPCSTAVQTRTYHAPKIRSVKEATSVLVLAGYGIPSMLWIDHPTVGSGSAM